MKKIAVALVAATLSLTAGAANFRLSYTENSQCVDYKVIENGQKVVISTLNEFDPGYEYNLNCYLKLENLSAQPMTFTISGTVNESLTNNEYGSIEFCTPKGCAASYPASESATLGGNASWGGQGFHLVYAIHDPNWEEIDVEGDETYWGTFTAHLEITCGSEKFGCDVMFVHNDDSFLDETLPGDANNDGAVDATDIAVAIDYMLGNEVPGFNLDAADMNGDGSVNASDISLLIDSLLN